MKFQKKCIVLGTMLMHILFWLMCASTAADEGQTADKKRAGDGSVVTIDDVVVRGEAASKDLEATSATVLNNDEIVNRIYITPLDIVSLSPGISVVQYK